MVPDKFWGKQGKYIMLLSTGTQQEGAAPLLKKSLQIFYEDITFYASLSLCNQMMNILNGSPYLKASGFAPFYRSI